MNDRDRQKMVQLAVACEKAISPPLPEAMFKPTVTPAAPSRAERRFRRRRANGQIGVFTSLRVLAQFGIADFANADAAEGRWKNR